MFDRALRDVEAALDDAGADLIAMSTNFREVIRANWEDAFATGLAACLSLFQGRYRTGLISSCYPHRALQFPCGSTPITDPLLSGTGFNVVHFGASRDRIEKARELSEWPEGLRRLRVCWQGVLEDDRDDPDQAGNCGRCEKCIRSILIFRALGLEPPESLGHQVTGEQVRSLRVRGRQLKAMRSLADFAGTQDVSAAWVRDLKICLWRNQLRSVAGAARSRLLRLRSRRRDGRPGSRLGSPLASR